MKIYQTETDINPILTLNKHESRTDKYNFISSTRVIQDIELHGFKHHTTSFAHTKKESKKGYQKHIMIFDHPNMFVDDGNKLQLLVTNSHDGTSSLVFNLGVFRTVCANGLVVGDSFQEIRIRHIVANNGIYKTVLDDILKQSGNYVEMVRKMMAINLNTAQINELRNAAQKARLRNVKNIIEVDHATTINHHRPEDSYTDLWTMFNVIQENMIRGGIKYKFNKKMKDENDNVIDITLNNTTRPVKGFKEVSYLNKQLWNAAEKLAA